jgi:hypothetical protein
MAFYQRVVQVFVFKSKVFESFQKISRAVQSFAVIKMYLNFGNVMKLGEPTRQLEFMHESRLVTRRTGQKCLEQTRVETRPTLLIKDYYSIPETSHSVLLLTSYELIDSKVRF